MAEGALQQFLTHGGRLAAARQAFPDAAQPWLDLSTGINPEPWRGARASLADLARLPDPQDLAALEAAAAGAFGADPARVVATAGAEMALRLIPHLTGARSAAIVSPTYGGHAQAWRMAGAAVAETTPGSCADADALVVVNPNNPDGATCDPRGLADGHRWLVVDESFADATPEVSVAGAALPRTIVLRSFGKFYGLAGVRLGFLIAEPELAARARAMLGDWPVSADAITLGRAAYADQAWAFRTRARLGGSAGRLDGILTRWGFEIAGGTPLFRLARHTDAQAAFLLLASRGVLVRPFAHDPTLLRFGLPGRRGWARLEQALS